MYHADSLQSQVAEHYIILLVPVLQLMQSQASDAMRVRAGTQLHPAPDAVWN